MKEGRLKLTLDGTIVKYERTTDDYPVRTGNFTIDEAWKDPQGNILCNITITDWGPVIYWLVRIRKSGKTFELVASHTGYDDYPKEMDPHDGWYEIYYCKK
jgi:hypothetical protein